VERIREFVRRLEANQDIEDGKEKEIRGGRTMEG